MNLQLPTRCLLLDKAIATLGAVGVELYPDFNVFEVAKPYARDLVLRRLTPAAAAQPGRKETTSLAAVLRELPYQCARLLEQVRDGQIEVGFVHKGLDDFMPRSSRLEPARGRARRRGRADRSALIGVFAKGGPHLLGLHVVSLIGFVLSGVLGVWLLWGVVRSGRL